MSNVNAPAAQKQTFSVAITTPQYQSLVNNTLKDPARANRFIASITSAVAVTPALQQATPASILAAGLVGEALNLSPSPQLGQYYLIPFAQKAKFDRNGNLISPECVNVQFVLGYKGYIQLALRSGQYSDLDCIEIRQGEYLGKDPATAKPRFKFVEDDDLRETLPVVGYMAYFEHLNGFQKVLYWSREKMLSHADRYSKAFSAEALKLLQNGEIPDKDLWKYSSFWYKDFDGMAKKTMLRQLISKFGIMTTELQQAIVSDSYTFKIDQKNGNVLPGEQPELLPDAQPKLLPDTDAPASPEYSPSASVQIDLDAL